MAFNKAKYWEEKPTNIGSIRNKIKRAIEHNNLLETPENCNNINGQWVRKQPKENN